MEVRTLIHLPKGWMEVILKTLKFASLEDYYMLGQPTGWVVKSLNLLLSMGTSTNQLKNS